jgi:hypothetical protein
VVQNSRVLWITLLCLIAYFHTQIEKARQPSCPHWIFKHEYTQLPKSTRRINILTIVPDGDQVLTLWIVDVSGVCWSSLEKD